MGMRVHGIVRKLYPTHFEFQNISINFISPAFGLSLPERFGYTRVTLISSPVIRAAFF
jgi:hypothetical protein